MSAAGLTAVATERASNVLADLRDLRRRLSPHPELYAESARLLPVLGVAAIAFVGVFPLFGSNDWILKLEEGLYFGLLALSLNILVGSAGMISFGQAMFLGIGAYTIAIPFRDHNINPLYLLALTPLAGALAALLTGFIVLRGRQLYFALLTLGVAQLFWAIAHGWQSFTGGTNGISGIIVPGWLNAYSPDGGNHLYWFIFACTLLCTIIVYVIVASPFGDALRAIRDNPLRAEFSGMWVKRYEMTAYIIAGTFGAVAGGLWILSDEGLTSDTLDWTKSAIVLVAVLIGGTRYFLGPFVGAIFWIYFFDEVHQATGKAGLLWDSILGAIVVFVALLAPGGVVGAVHTALAYGLGFVRRITGRPIVRAATVEATREQEVVHLPNVEPLPVRPKAAVNGRPPVLELQHLSKRFGGLVAVDDVNLTVRQGSIHAVIGPNGAGKSTLFNLITGLHKPDSGRVLLGEHDVTGKPAWQLVKRGVGRSFQQTNLFWTLPSILNVQVAGSAVHGDSLKPFGRHSKQVTRRGQELLRRVGLQGFTASAANELSHGDQRSLEIATALAVDAKMLLLDEPTAGLAHTDTETAVELIRRIAREEDLTVLFVEHDMEVVFGIADFITVMNKGAVLAEGTPEEIRENEAVREAYLGGEELTHVEEERGA